MTAHLILSYRRRRPVRVAIALCIIMAAVLLTAGCMGGDVKMDQDLAVIKLNHDGSMDWMKTIDSGKDDEVTDAIQTSDGGYALAGGYSTPMCNAWSHFPTTPRIIRLSDKGDTIWDKEFTSEMTDKSGYADPIKGLVQTPDLGFYIISQHGDIIKISPEGIPSGSRLHDNDVLNKTEINSIIRTHDGGSVIAGFTLQCKFEQRIECPPDHRDFKAFIEKLDQNGETSWSRSFADRDFFIAYQILELNDEKGYASIMESFSNESLVVLDKNGTLVNASVLSSEISNYKMQAAINGFSAVTDRISNNNTYEEYSFTNEGIRTGIKYVNNNQFGLALTNRNISLGAGDKDYLTVNLVPPDNSVYPTTTSLHVVKSNDSGEQIWDRQVTTLAANSHFIHVRNLIETTDGGYLMVLGVEKTRSC